MKRLRNKADRLLQQKYVKGRCEVCGKPAQVAHHIVPKSQSNNLRYDPDNLAILCNACHFAHHTKGDPKIISKIIEIRGLEFMEELQKRRYQICKFNKGYLEEIINELENK